MKLKTWDYLKKELVELAKDNAENINRQQIVRHINPPKKSSGSFARMTANFQPQSGKFMVARKSTMEKAMRVLADQIKKSSGAERRMDERRLKTIQATYVNYYGGDHGQKSR